MTLISILLATSWAATITALLMTEHRQHARIQELLNQAAGERARLQSVHNARITSLLDTVMADRAKPNPDTTALIALIERMAQRIQAPEQAVIDHALQTELPPTPTAVMPDDDQGFWESREDLAARAMTDELAEADASG
jgi:uncharacterized iron-regulated membrane protein